MEIKKENIMKYEYNEDHLLEDEMKRSNVVGVSLIMMATIILVGGAIAMLCCGCTLSFTNVMTDGSASDVVDSDPRSDVPVTTNLTVPLKAM